MNSYSFNLISDKYPIIGIITAACMLCIAIMLQYTQRLANIDHYLIAFNSLKTNRRLLRFVTVLYYIAAIIPTLLLIAWAVSLFVSFGVSPGLPVLLHGLFFNLLILPCKDTLYYYKLLGISLLFVAAQLTTILTSNQWSVSSAYSYFSISAVLLIMNGCIVSIAMWIVKGKSWELQDSLLPVKDQFAQWCPAWLSYPHPLILTGGLYSTLCNHLRKKSITIGIYFSSWLCLLALAFVIYYATPYGILGSVTAIAVVTTDLLILLIINLENELFVSPNVVSLLVMMIRVCLFGFTADYWFMGYCLLYLLLMAYIFYLIVDKNYPSFQKIPTMEVKRVDLLKMPQTVGIIGTVLFGAIIFYLANQKQINIPITTIKIGSIDYPYWAIGLGAILLTIALYFYLTSLRLLQRRRNHIRQFSGFYLGWAKISEYQIYALLAYIMIVIFGCYFYVSVDNPIIWLTTVFIPLIYEAFLQFYQNWQENDYRIFGDVEKYNLKIKKRSDAQDNLKKKQDEIMEKMKNNTKTAGFFKQKKHINKVNPISILIENNNSNSKGIIPAETSNVKLRHEEDQESQLFEFNKPQYSSFRPINDWRKHESFWHALVHGNLLPTDKRILISVPIIIALMLVFSLICLLVYNESLAFAISAEILFLFLTIIPIRRFFSTLQRPQVFQVIMFCLGIVLNFVFGAVGLANGWRTQTVWTIWWAFINPLIVCIYALWGLVRDYGVTAASITIATLTVLIGFGMGVFIIINVDLIGGLAVIGGAAYTAYFLATGLYYLKNNHSLPKIFLIIAAVLMILTAVAVMIASFILPEFDNFLGFSITYLVLNFLLLGYSAYLLIDDLNTRIEAPNFYSPYGLPIYKYRRDLESCQTNRLPMVLYIIGLFVLFFYCILVQIFVNPSNVGVSLSCIFQVLIFVSVMYFLTYNSYQAGIVKQKITNEIVVESWAKEKEVQIKLKQIVASQEGSLMKNMTDQLNSLKRDYEFEKDEQSKSALLVQVSDLEYKLDKEINEELLVGVNLWVRCLSGVQGLQRKEMHKLVAFVNGSADILASMGILIIVDNILDLESKYRQVKSDYNLLAPEQKIKFDFAFAEWQKERAKSDQIAEQKERQQEEEKQRREAELIKKLQEQNNNKEDDQQLPLDQMRDSPAKLKKMLDIYKGDNFYSDQVFKADKEILPVDIRTQCRKFSRPEIDSFLIDDSDGAFDVRQGIIGNCYLISAIGILTRKYCEKVLGIGEWKNPDGAYMVRFKKLGHDIYVIVDNEFPVGVDDTWLLGRCENDKELYVNVIEKAFAKLYGGYDKIIGGKVNITLAEMTGGFPEQIKLSKYQDSGTIELFDKMLNYYQMGYLIGAGSPENAQGDSVIIEGIVQGHAYQILKVADLDGNRLIKLRNPHGSEGCEWTGDWSDQSEKWTQRLLELVKETMVQDGAFWMSIDDFVYCFKSLYICRIFEPATWKTVTVEGRWQGEKAAGLPSKANPGALISKNPHYGIKVYKKCTLFLELQQNEVETSWKGKNFIYYMVQRNAGKRIKTISIDKLCGKSDSAVNTSTISGQMELEATSYPYTFSVVVACINAGDQGSFNLSIYCNDMDVQVIDDKDFDV